ACAVHERVLPGGGTPCRVMLNVPESSSKPLKVAVYVPVIVVAVTVPLKAIVVPMLVPDPNWMNVPDKVPEAEPGPREVVTDPVNVFPVCVKVPCTVLVPPPMSLVAVPLQLPVILTAVSSTIYS